MATTGLSGEVNIGGGPTTMEEATASETADAQDTPQGDVAVVRQDDDGEKLQQSSEEPPVERQTLARAVDAMIEHQEAQERESCRSWLESLQSKDFFSVIDAAKSNDDWPKLSLSEYQRMVRLEAQRRMQVDPRGWEACCDASSGLVGSAMDGIADGMGLFSEQTFATPGIGNRLESQPPPYEAVDRSSKRAGSMGGMDRPSERSAGNGAFEGGGQSSGVPRDTYEVASDADTGLASPPHTPVTHATEQYGLAATHENQDFNLNFSIPQQPHGFTHVTYQSGVNQPITGPPGPAHYQAHLMNFTNASLHGSHFHISHNSQFAGGMPPMMPSQPQLQGLATQGAPGPQYPGGLPWSHRAPSGMPPAPDGRSKAKSQRVLTEEQRKAAESDAMRRKKNKEKHDKETSRLNERIRLKEIARNGSSLHADPVEKWRLSEYDQGIASVGGLRAYLEKQLTFQQPDADLDFLRELFDEAWCFQEHRMRREKVMEEKARMRREKEEEACRYRRSLASQSAAQQPYGFTHGSRVDTAHMIAMRDAAPLPIMTELTNQDSQSMGQRLAGGNMVADQAPQYQPSQSQYPPPPNGFAVPAMDGHRRHANRAPPQPMNVSPAALGFGSDDAPTASGLAQPQASQQEQGDGSLMASASALQSWPPRSEHTSAAGDLVIRRIGDVDDFDQSLNLEAN